jgi:hypothetical protein
MNIASIVLVGITRWLLVMIQQDVDDVVTLVTPLLITVPDNPLTLTVVVF